MPGSRERLQQRTASCSSSSNSSSTSGKRTIQAVCVPLAEAWVKFGTLPSRSSQQLAELLTQRARPLDLSVPDSLTRWVKLMALVGLPALLQALAARHRLDNADPPRVPACLYCPHLSLQAAGAPGLLTSISCGLAHGVMQCACCRACRQGDSGQGKGPDYPAGQPEHRGR